MKTTNSLTIKVAILPDHLRVQIANSFNRPARVWDLGNSWGGAAWSLRLRMDDNSGRTLTLRPSNQIYTRNLPRFVEVPPGGVKEMRMFPTSREWTGGDDLSPWRNRPLYVQVLLDIAPSPETKEHNVEVVRAHSDELLSQPPHAWLFGATP